MSENNAVLYWLLNYSIPEFSVNPTVKAAAKGRILIAARQLWSLMEGASIRSCLIGPGVVMGNYLIRGVNTEFYQNISGVVFDPTELRLDEPIPLVDIINPEVIDPTASAEFKAIEQRILKIIVRKGQVLAPVKIAEVTTPVGLPITAMEDNELMKVKLSYVTGLAKAKFVLGGQNRLLYQRFLTSIKDKTAAAPQNRPLLQSDTKYFNPVKSDDLNRFIIVEKMQGALIVEEPKTYDQFLEEYAACLEFMHLHKDAFMF